MKKFYKSPHLFPALTLLLGGLPFAVYVIEQKLGMLPSSDSWYANGANHGPWRDSIEVLTIYYPIVILIFVTFTVFILRGIKEKKINHVVVGMLLIIIQIGILISQMHLLTWTID